jgi:vacuolar-type H+-ATPase subunit D/Vma8
MSKKKVLKRRIKILEEKSRTLQELNDRLIADCMLLAENKADLKTTMTRTKYRFMKNFEQSVWFGNYGCIKTRTIPRAENKS